MKVDWCNSEGLDPEVQYAKFRDALAQAGRPIVFSICNWGQKEPWRWGPRTGNLWRTTTDIADSWEGQVKWPDGACCAIGVLDIVDKQVGLEAYAGPGHWNDPDMLEVGNGGMTLTEYRAHFSLWAMLAAPLMAGNDLRNMTPEIRDILTNREAIAVDQDPLGRQGQRVWKDGWGFPGNQTMSRRLPRRRCGRSSSSGNWTRHPMAKIPRCGASGVRSVWGSLRAIEVPSSKCTEIKEETRPGWAAG